MHGLFSRALGAASVVALGGTMLSGCAILGDGPLVVTGLGSGTCSTVPAEEAATYFGVLLDNTDGADATLVSASVSEATNLAGAEILLDTQGPARDLRVGSMTWPAETPDGWEADVMAGVVDPTDAVVEEGTEAQLLVALHAEDPAADVGAEEMTVTYRSGGHMYTVRPSLHVRVDADQHCED